MNVVKDFMNAMWTVLSEVLLVAFYLFILVGICIVPIYLLAWFWMQVLHGGVPS